MTPRRNTSRLFGLLTASICVLVAPAADASMNYDYVIDYSQSTVTITALGSSFEANMQGTFEFSVDPSLVAGAVDTIRALNSAVDDINMGLASLKNVTIVSLLGDPANGLVEDAVPNDGFVELNQYLPIIVDYVYDPLFGASVAYTDTMLTCVGVGPVCTDSAGTSASSLNTNTFDFTLHSSETIPAADSPTGTEITLTMDVLGHGTPNVSSTMPTDGAATRSLSVWPNPAGGDVSIRFGMNRTDVEAIDVVDVRGRRVALLGTGSSADDSHTIQWNGIGLTGERVLSGVYFVRVRDAQGIVARRVVMLR
ncbi:MAG: T9SS type A sorting domain-containing protein [Gemmatimonadota bacterium]|nr:T9SS type A sorting domain-containing protein [Gemmatimonadota bacterium]MDP6801580.1 T9SS type A sorting domain-containing protein [Gemmatimonadota bacterium]